MTKYYQVRILSKLTQKELEALKKNREKALREIVEDLEERVSDEFPMMIEDFKEPDIGIGPDSDDLIFGLEQKDKLLKEVSCWNEALQMDSVLTYELCEKKAEKSGVSFKDYLFNAEPKKLHGDYTLTSFADTLYTLTGRYMRGGYRLCFCEPYPTTLIGKEIIKEILANPEMYFIAELTYY